MKALWIVLGTYTTVWGLWLLSPWWDVFSVRAGLYSQMSDFMPEWAWGLHAVAIGCSILYGIIYRWPRGLWWGRTASFYHWGLIAVFYGLGDWRSTGIITALMLIAGTQVLWANTPQTPEVHPLD